MATTPKTMQVELTWAGKTGRLAALTLAQESDSFRDNRDRDRHTRDILFRAEVFHTWLESGLMTESMEDFVLEFIQWGQKVGFVSKEAWMTESELKRVAHDFIAQQDLSPEDDSAPEENLKPAFDSDLEDLDNDDINVIRKERNKCGHCDMSIVRTEGYPWVHEDFEKAVEWMNEHGEHQATPMNLASS